MSDSICRLGGGAGHPPSQTESRMTEDQHRQRKKTPLACDGCRAKKIKCDGTRPACGTCSRNRRRKINCVYNDAQRPRGSVSKRLVSELQGRIRDLEGQRRTSQALSVMHEVPGDHEHISPIECNSSPKEGRVYSSEPLRQEQWHLRQLESSAQVLPLASFGDAGSSNYQDGPESQHQILEHSNNNANSNPGSTRNTEDRQTGVRAIVGAVTGEPQIEGFLGSSSAAAFMKQIRLAVDSTLGILSPDKNSADILRTTVATPRIRTLLNYDLPPRKLADSLLDAYWEYVHPIYPFLSKRGFMELYNDIWTGNENSPPTSTNSVISSARDETTTICILNLVLALSCQWAEAIEPERRHVTSKIYFARAQELLKFDPIDSADRSLQLVQALLLMGQYLQITGSTHRAWVIIGNAIRVCQELGLHLPVNAGEGDSRRSMEREIVRRVYHGCLMMERMLCMNLGRPVMLSTLADSVPLPLEIDDEYLEIQDVHGLTGEPSSIEQPLGRPSIISFSVMSATLYKLVQRMLTSLYLDNNITPPHSYDKYFTGPESIFQIDIDLMKWYKKIPNHLKLRSLTIEGDPARRREKEDWIFHRQAVVLWTRFLQARIYLLRPIVSQFCTTSRLVSMGDANNNVEEPGTSVISNIPLDEMLSHKTALQCSIICAKVAMDLISVVYHNLATDTPSGQKPAWLFSVLHVYLSATVLVAVQLKPSIMSEISKSDIELSWQQALEILHRCQGDNHSALRCVAALKILYEKLPKHTTQSQQDQNQWQDDVFGEVHASESYITASSSGNYPLWQNGAAFEDFGLLDLTDMSWFNVLPPTL